MTINLCLRRKKKIFVINFNSLFAFLPSPIHTKKNFHFYLHWIFFLFHFLNLSIICFISKQNLFLLATTKEFLFIFFFAPLKSYRIHLISSWWFYLTRLHSTTLKNFHTNKIIIFSAQIEKSHKRSKFFSSKSPQVRWKLLTTEKVYGKQKWTQKFFYCIAMDQNEDSFLQTFLNTMKI